MTTRHWTVAVTGASGSVYAQRLCRDLAGRKGVRVNLVMSEAGARVIREELGVALDLEDGPGVIRALAGAGARNFHYDHYKDIGAGIASGTHPTEGMVVIPCTTGTLGGIASGVSRNLIERAAEVVMKERKNLILVLRETPLSLVTIENMARLARAGVCILPAVPGFYHLPKTLEDVVDFLVGKVLGQMGFGHRLIRRRVKRGGAG
ncbi:MAG: UbiX family flavin prenyltransferase [Candidatus Brocadiae bacterium]|nr:UbiX family flavin prenyltransferase [Candidatus Brocadiia bacterium]